MADTLTVPPSGVAGICSASKTNKVTYKVSVDKADGVFGIYLMPKTEYDKLEKASKGGEPVTLQFDFYKDMSCHGGGVTSCVRNSGDTPLSPEDQVCVAIVNTQPVKTQATISLDFNNSKPLTSITNNGSLLRGVWYGASMLAVGLWHAVV
jgi:hypothetical protein